MRKANNPLWGLNVEQEFCRDSIFHSHRDPSSLMELSKTILFYHLCVDVVMYSLDVLDVASVSPLQTRVSKLDNILEWRSKAIPW